MTSSLQVAVCVSSAIQSRFSCFLTTFFCGNYTNHLRYLREGCTVCWLCGNWTIIAWTRFFPWLVLVSFVICVLYCARLIVFVLIAGRSNVNIGAMDVIYCSHCKGVVRASARTSTAKVHCCNTCWKFWHSSSCVPANGLSCCNKLVPAGEITGRANEPVTVADVARVFGVSVEVLHAVAGTTRVSQAAPTLRPPTFGFPPALVSSQNPAAAAVLMDDQAASPGDAMLSEPADDRVPGTQGIRLIAGEVREAVQKLDPSQRDLGAVLCILASSLDDARVDGLQAARTLVRHAQQLEGHESRISALEDTLGMTKAVAEDAREDSARSLCVAMEVEPYDLIIRGIPFTDAESAVPVVVSIGRALNIQIHERYVTSVRAAKRKSYSQALGGSAQDAALGRTPAAASTVGSQARPSGDVFVTFKSSFLRSMLLGNLREKGVLRLSDLDCGLQGEERINIFEVLTRRRSAAFNAVRLEAANLGYHRAWHRDGVFFVRKTPTSTPRRVYCAEELSGLRD